MIIDGVVLQYTSVWSAHLIANFAALEALAADKQIPTSKCTHLWAHFHNCSI